MVTGLVVIFSGLRGEGKDYHYKHQNVNNEIFLRLIYQRKFKDALIWTITLINKLVSIYSAEDSNRVEEIVLFDSAHKSEKSILVQSKCGFLEEKRI